MVRTGLGILLVLAFVLQAPAADSPEKGASASGCGWQNGHEKGKIPRANALPVNELLERASRSPLGPGEARLLRAVADLVEKEQVPNGNTSVTEGFQPLTALRPSPAAVQAAPSVPLPNAAPSEQRTRLVIRLSHAPVVDVAKALEGFLDGELKARRAPEDIPDPDRAILVPEPVSNSLLLSGTPRTVDEVTRLIADLDRPPDAVMVNVCIAELLPPSRDAKTDDGLSGDSAVEKAPCTEKDGAAWFAWAKKHGRLEVLARPQIMTLDNQTAYIQIGTTAATGALKPGPASPPKGNQTPQAFVGLTVGLTPRISPEGLVVLELDVEHTSVVNRDGAAGPTIGKTLAQTTISAKDGQTAVVGGLMEGAEDGRRRMIIAVTPWVNPKR